MDLELEGFTVVFGVHARHAVVAYVAQIEGLQERRQPHERRGKVIRSKRAPEKMDNKIDDNAQLRNEIDEYRTPYPLTPHVHNPSPEATGVRKNLCEKNSGKTDRFWGQQKALLSFPE